jgi:hypothetical protein
MVGTNRPLPPWGSTDKSRPLQSSSMYTSSYMFLDLVLLSVIKDHHIPIIRRADLCQVARVQIGGSHFDVVGREGMFGEVV